MSFPPTHSTRASSHHGYPLPQGCFLPMEGEHQLEKLQFALAVALTRGDALRSSELREAIAKLGENREEPGT